MESTRRLSHDIVALVSLMPITTVPILGTRKRLSTTTVASSYRGRKTEAFCTTPTHPSFVEALVLGRRKLR